MLPKLAFFASTIEELQKELRPAVEEVIIKHDIPITSILVNVGDEKLTNNDDIRKFNHLDTAKSTKQFIPLVNKVREGWNCRSLFGVALFREPKSIIFVLQATMRCLHSIGEVQQTGQVYLSAENRHILDDDLQQNFRISADDLTNTAKKKQEYEIHIIPSPVKLKLQRIRRQFDMQEKDLTNGFSLDLEKVNIENYRITQTEEQSLPTSSKHHTITIDLTHKRTKRVFSQLTLVAEISRYINKPCRFIERLLASTQEGTEKIITAVNEYNEILYDWVIPHLFNQLYEITNHEKTEEYEVELVKTPEKGFYKISASPNLVITHQTDPKFTHKSFHLDTYCFDSDPERNLFWNLIRDGRVKKLYFTGMLTHGQSDFYVQYIDPESHTVRSYYPDFLVHKEDGTYIIVGDDKIDDLVVQAKQEFAQQIAIAAGMSYKIIKGTDANKGRYDFLLSAPTLTTPYQPHIA